MGLNRFLKHLPRRKRTPGAKARLIFQRLTAQLKSCPSWIRLAARLEAAPFQTRIADQKRDRGGDLKRGKNGVVEAILKRK